MIQAEAKSYQEDPNNSLYNMVEYVLYTSVETSVFFGNKRFWTRILTGLETAEKNCCT